MEKTVCPTTGKQFFTFKIRWGEGLIVHTDKGDTVYFAAFSGITVTIWLSEKYDP